METRNKIWRDPELYVVICMYLFCAVLAWQISRITIAESRMLPLVSLAIALVSATDVLVVLVQGKCAARKLADAWMNRKETVVFLMLLVSVWLYPVLGFYATIALLSFGVILVLEAPLNKKKILTSVVYVAVMMAVIFAGFSVLLGMVTPAGLLI